MKKKSIVALVMFLSILFLTGMGSAPKKKPFNIGFNEWVGFAPFFLAKEKGFYGNLEVNLHFIDLEGNKRAGLYSDKFQMIAETMDMFQTNRDKSNYPGEIVFAIDQSLGGDGVVASKEIQSLKDAKGKVVVSEPGLPAHFVLQYLLKKEGMTFKDLDLQDMGSSDAAAAFIAGKADIAGTYEPYISKALEKRKGAHLLVSTKDLPGLLVDVGIVNKPTLENRKEDIRIVYKGWCEAMEHYKASPNDAISIMAKTFKLSDQEFKETISGLEYYDCAMNKKFFQESDGIYKKFKLIGKILMDNGLTKAIDLPEKKVNGAFVNSQ